MWLTCDGTAATDRRSHGALRPRRRGV